MCHLKNMSFNVFFFFYIKDCHNLKVILTIQHVYALAVSITPPHTPPLPNPRKLKWLRMFEYPKVSVDFPQHHLRMCMPLSKI